MGFRKHFRYFIILITNLLLIYAAIDVKIGYCRIQCSEKCAPREPEVSGEKKYIKGYYWRDYHGVIPPDALLLGPAHQYPRTYIGLVFDHTKNGTYPTTIFEGLDYVYTTRYGKTKQLDSNIQILCTMEPERFFWFKLTSENVGTRRSGDILVDGGSSYAFHVFKYHYIVKTFKCSIAYGGFVTGIGEKLEYVLMDGTSETTKSFLWLMYRPSKGPFDKQGKNKEEPFISHIYEYAVREGTMIPYFYRRTRIGYCTLTCQNEKSINRNVKQSMEATTSMAYYWRPADSLKKGEAFIAGNAYDNSSLFVGQAYSYFNIFDVGQSNGHWVSIIGDRGTLQEYKYFKTLCLQQPDKFEWIGADYESFSLLDKSSLIPGGLLQNGTRTFVGRVKDDVLVAPGSIRNFNVGAYCYANHRAYEKYEVLVYKRDKK